ncbi:unnamed protein product, partial [marine sediment metagenome]
RIRPCNVGEYTSIAIGTDGNPVISYFDKDSKNLKFTKCISGNCTSTSDWTTATVDSTNDVGSYTSIAIGTDGWPVVSYFDDTNDNLKVTKQ